MDVEEIDSRLAREKRRYDGQLIDTPEYKARKAAIFAEAEGAEGGAGPVESSQPSRPVLYMNYSTMYEWVA